MEKLIHVMCNHFLVAPQLFGSWEHNASYKSKKEGKISNRYNQAPHLTQDTIVNVTTSQLDITNGSQKVGPFPAGDHKVSPGRRA